MERRKKLSHSCFAKYIPQSDAWRALVNLRGLQPEVYEMVLTKMPKHEGAGLGHTFC